MKAMSNYSSESMCWSKSGYESESGSGSGSRSRSWSRSGGSL